MSDHEPIKQFESRFVKESRLCKRYYGLLVLFIHFFYPNLLFVAIKLMCTRNVNCVMQFLRSRTSGIHFHIHIFIFDYWKKYDGIIYKKYWCDNIKFFITKCCYVMKNYDDNSLIN